MDAFEFEIAVQQIIRNAGSHLGAFQVKHREHVEGADGEYEIDILFRFEAVGADFLVLVECKKHRHPIKRDVVQLLADRVRSVGAQKGMIFATSHFQRGAIEYAKAHGIALAEVQCSPEQGTTGGQTRPVSSEGTDLQGFPLLAVNMVVRCPPRDILARINMINPPGALLMTVEKRGTSRDFKCELSESMIALSQFLLPR